MVRKILIITLIMVIVPALCQAAGFGSAGASGGPSFRGSVSTASIGSGPIGDPDKLGMTNMGIGTTIGAFIKPGTEQCHKRIEKMGVRSGFVRCPSKK
ncbi:MAG: hypothetical protein ABFD62_09945 [Syntrophaceae bacterium]